MPEDIRLDRKLDDPAVIALLESHLADMRAISPPGSVHALDLDALRAQDVRFWTLWRVAPNTETPALAGCAAIKRLDKDHGEIKSMRTAAAFLRQGVASALLVHVIDDAVAMGLTRLSLETGSTEHFASARTLYATHGFEPCPPFADYLPDPHSVFMTREL